MATLGSVFPGFDCPDRGHRVQGGPPGRRTRSATPTLDLPWTGSHSPAFGAYEEDGAG